ncbi:Sec-independent protein translocase protein TatB [Sinorhizobium alkalisoli]|uniref:Sec-independent protein translocase protein TatB n=1 Tax=Sinorhizobium alkalisoli TaxID=1752398 RepID=A0A1E3VE11_9HYPH|nr:Sec-independent protein translocase protein TatB [Sinorhizobium alkalisoli]MCA1492773.1 twin-arginine translocase subunit TatB [Ensifer sp. NBAIM29]MCG5477863.1 Sec-independent protein translocase protein TatB [Sinorhizobium alkalisoli]ODR91830.1 twin arginine-targeting protein translocase TatB [Sinorhizobium alkalisoli]QFI66182.1 Twin-arginine translocation protein TatB [Sinorhizobium alkalisoli]
MLDIGWTELVVIAIVLIVVVGPKDLPPMLRAFGRMTSKMRGMAGDFRRQFDEALREADLDDVRRTISDAQSLNPTTALRDAMNPLRQLGNEIKSDLQKAATPDKAAQTAPESGTVPANTSMPAVEPGEAVAATAAETAPGETERSAPATQAADAKPKRAAKPKAEPNTLVAAKPAPKRASAAAAAKKSTARKLAAGSAEVEAKSGKTRAASRKKGDA